MPAIEAVIFDLGRVLLGIDPARGGFSSLLRAAGLDPETVFRDFRRDAEVDAFMTGSLPPRGFYLALRRRFGFDHDFASFAECWCDLFAPVPGMEAVFRETAARRRVGILSDTDPLHWEKALSLLPFLSLAPRPTLSFATGVLKPARPAFLAAADDVGTAPDRCLFIDDLAENVRGARAAGMAAVRFSGAVRLREDLAELGILRDPRA